MKIRVRTRMDNDAFILLLASQMIIAFPYIHVGIYAGLLVVILSLMVAFYRFSKLLFEPDIVKSLLLQFFASIGIVSGNLTLLSYVNNKVFLSLSLITFNIIETTILLISLINFFLLMELHCEKQLENNYESDVDVKSEEDEENIMNNYQFS